MTVLSRPGCHLCDEAIAELEGYLVIRDGAEEKIEVEVVNIEENDRLHQQYLERIPVVRIGEETVSEFTFDPDAFEVALERRQRRAG